MKKFIYLAMALVLITTAIPMDFLIIPDSHIVWRMEMIVVFSALNLLVLVVVSLNIYVFLHLKHREKVRKKCKQIDYINPWEKLFEV